MMTYIYCPECKDFFPASEFSYMLRQIVKVTLNDEGYDDDWDVVDEELIEFTHETCGSSFDQRLPELIVTDDAIEIGESDLLQLPKEQFVNFLKKHSDKILEIRTTYYEFADVKFNETLYYNGKKLYITLGGDRIANTSHIVKRELMRIADKQKTGTIKIPVKQILEVVE